VELVIDKQEKTPQGAPKKAPLMGAVKPRVMSIPLQGASRGDEFAAFAESIGYTLDPWQKYIADDFLTMDADGNFIRKTIMVCVSRQNGKTLLAALRILAGLFVFGEKSIIAMSSNRSMALTTFRQVVGIIESNEALRCQVKLNIGKVGRFGSGLECVELKNGARYEIVAATDSGARGKSADLLFIDELRSISTEAWDAAKPTTRARPNAQTFLCSNAGDAFSTVLNNLRDRAISYPAQSLGWYEYSAPQHAKIDDRKAWAMANPSLGIRISEAVLAEALSTDTPETFRTESLTQWISSLSSPWPQGAWEACADTQLKLAPGPVTFFGFDVAQGRRTASLMAGQYLDDGTIAVGMLDAWRSDNAVDDLVIAAKIKEHADKYRPQLILFDHYATASIAARLTASALKCEDISGQRFYQASGDLLDAIVAKRVVHAGQPALDEQMNACAAKTNDASWRLVRRASAGDISGPIALAMIVHKMNEPISLPMIITG
jgi:phage terminase large subunit-like protein